MQHQESPSHSSTTHQGAGDKSANPPVTTARKEPSDLSTPEFPRTPERDCLALIGVAGARAVLCQLSAHREALVGYTCS